MEKRPRARSIVARTSAEYLAYFWERVSIAEGCWEWTGNMAGDYPCLPTGRTNVQEYAHRFSWQLHHGPIPEGMFVLHSCDNPPCVNPGHVFLGTHTDNMRDMVNKGRQAAPRGCQTCGNQCTGRRCLSCAEARSIANAKASQSARAPHLTSEQLDSLPERWRQVVVAYYGIGVPRQKGEAIGEELGITRQRVSQSLAASFRQLGVTRPRIKCTRSGKFPLTGVAA